MKYRNTFAVVAISLALGSIPVAASAQSPEGSVCPDHETHMMEPGHIGVMASTMGGGHIAGMAQMGHVGHMASMFGQSRVDRA